MLFWPRQSAPRACRWNERPLHIAPPAGGVDEAAALLADGFHLRLGSPRRRGARCCRGPSRSPRPTHQRRRPRASLAASTTAGAYSRRQRPAARLRRRLTNARIGVRGSSHARDDRSRAHQPIRAAARRALEAGPRSAALESCSVAGPRVVRGVLIAWVDTLQAWRVSSRPPRRLAPSTTITRPSGRLPRTKPDRAWMFEAGLARAAVRIRCTSVTSRHWASRILPSSWAAPTGADSLAASAHGGDARRRAPSSLPRGPSSPSQTPATSFQARPGPLHRLGRARGRSSRTAPGTSSFAPGAGGP